MGASTQGVVASIWLQPEKPRWCKGELLFSVIQVGACMIGNWCFHPVGAGNTQGVGARKTRELVLPSSWC